MNFLKIFNPEKLDIDIPWATPWGCASLINTLTPRQRETAEQIAMGVPLNDAAKSMGISRKTFDVLLVQVREKLGVGTNGIGRVYFAAMAHREVNQG